jgi:hypothetical protein
MDGKLIIWTGFFVTYTRGTTTKHDIIYCQIPTKLKNDAKQYFREPSYSEVNRIIKSHKSLCSSNANFEAKEKRKNLKGLTLNFSSL